MVWPDTTLKVHETCFKAYQVHFFGQFLQIFHVCLGKKLYFPVVGSSLLSAVFSTSFDFTYYLFLHLNHFFFSGGISLLFEIASVEFLIVRIFGSKLYQFVFFRICLFQPLIYTTPLGSRQYYWPHIKDEETKTPSWLMELGIDHGLPTTSKRQAHCCTHTPNSFTQSLSFSLQLSPSLLSLLLWILLLHFDLGVLLPSPTGNVVLWLLDLESI